MCSSSRLVNIGKRGFHPGGEDYLCWVWTHEDNETEYEINPPRQSREIGLHSKKRNFEKSGKQHEQDKLANVTL